MSEPIKVGDLVVVVRYGVSCPRGCNKGTDTLGRIFSVRSVEYMPLLCVGCDAPKGWATAAVAESGEQVYRVERLKRIPPLSELDDVKQDEEITA